MKTIVSEHRIFRGKVADTLIGFAVWFNEYQHTAHPDETIETKLRITGNSTDIEIEVRCEYPDGSKLGTGDR